jgi:hypothetical protein
LHGLLRYFTAICDRSFWIPVRTEMPARHTPDQLAWGPRSSARPNIHDDRNGIFRAGPAPWRSSGFDCPTRGFMHFVSLGPLSLGSHVDARGHRFSCPFSP